MPATAKDEPDVELELGEVNLFVEGATKTSTMGKSDITVQSPARPTSSSMNRRQSIMTETITPKPTATASSQNAQNIKQRPVSALNVPNKN